MGGHSSVPLRQLAVDEATIPPGQAVERLSVGATWGVDAMRAGDEVARVGLDKSIRQRQMARHR